MRPLKTFSDDDLIEELVRRRNSRSDTKPRHWCHDCHNFVAWNDAERTGPMPDTFNPCVKDHKMKFLAPVAFEEEYGFYVRVCADRAMSATATEGAG